ncbi:hypothetical protein ACIBH1_02550 [Nonomuraea sp. NPDC050663]|uniref:Uncharacterized protein n=1 Tax=Nonomuraea soli TaxID=1032476 RepID=A0A7W0HR05_9ACTN|nr:hypothetical protein [Nonomuraea soli]MBA2892508.1 hypothetical protein [Nonomuraea soli]NUT39284.1 hypothetical protein [Thermoactinospora sp.]
MAEVDNPKWEYLKNLLDKVHAIQGAMDKKLNKPANAMDSGKVWTSKTATEWKGHLHDRVKAYNGAVGALDDEVSAMLSATPRKCSQEEADRWHQQVNSYNRTSRY